MPGWFRRGSNQGACISQGGDTVKRSLWAYNEVPLSLEMEMSCLPRPPPPFFPSMNPWSQAWNNFSTTGKDSAIYWVPWTARTTHKPQKKPFGRQCFTGICTSLPLVRPTKVLFAWNTLRGICCAARWGEMFFLEAKVSALSLSIFLSWLYVGSTPQDASHHQEYYISNRESFKSNPYGCHCCIGGG